MLTGFIITKILDMIINKALKRCPHRGTETEVMAQEERRAEEIMDLSGFAVVAPFKGDPFVGQLSTPITTSRFTNMYLQSLPIYNPNLSPIMKGLHIGVTHGYILFGPFATLGPLRNTELANFIGFSSAISLIFILTACLFIYGIVSYDNSGPVIYNNSSLAFYDSEESEVPKINVLSKKGWSKFTSGFVLGGLAGAGIAYSFMSFIDFLVKS